MKRRGPDYWRRNPGPPFFPDQAVSIFAVRRTSYAVEDGKRGSWPYSRRPAQIPPDRVTYALRTPGDPLSYVRSVHEIVREADSRIPVTKVVTQAAEIDRTISREITFAKLCTGFAVLALLMACVGLYGTMSYNVARQTGEIGIRMALGAQRGSVVWMVLRRVLLLAGVGIAISVPAALVAFRLVRSLLFETQPNDPGTLALAAVVLTGAAILAGYVPARRASRIDPLAALRQE